MSSSFESRFSRRDFLSQAAPAAMLLPAAAAAAAESKRSEKQERIKIGQMGVGHSHAEGKMRVLRNSPDYEVVGIVETDAELREEAASRDTYDGLPWMIPEQLLNVPGLQAVAVETQVKDLLAAAEPCIAAGKHIHLDKPPGASLPRFRRLLASADQQGLIVQLGYMYRYNPGVVLLHEMLEKGWLGELFELHAVMSKVVGDQKRQKWSKFAGGTMFELGCHLVDLAVCILGRPQSVTAFPQHAAAVDDSLADNMLAVFKYPRALATIKSSALEVEGFERRHLVVCGTEGTLQIQPLDAPVVRLALSSPRGSYSAEYQQIDVGKYERYVDDLADLARIIRGEKSADYTSAHDLAVQETLFASCGLPIDD